MLQHQGVRKADYLRKMCYLPCHELIHIVLNSLIMAYKNVVFGHTDNIG